MIEDWEDASALHVDDHKLHTVAWAVVTRTDGDWPVSVKGVCPVGRTVVRAELKAIEVACGLGARTIHTDAQTILRRWETLGRCAGSAEDMSKSTLDLRRIPEGTDLRWVKAHQKCDENV